MSLPMMIFTLSSFAFLDALSVTITSWPRITAMALSFTAFEFATITSCSVIVVPIIVEATEISLFSNTDLNISVSSGLSALTVIPLLFLPVDLPDFNTSLTICSTDSFSILFSFSETFSLFFPQIFFFLFPFQ